MTGLAVRTWGSGSRRALLVHGITSSAETMWELGEFLASCGWTAVAVDLPGHGDSGPVDSYAFPEVAEAVLSAVGDGFDVYCGHSLGGAVGTVLLARHPAVARRALLIDPALYFPGSRDGSLVDDLVRDKALGVDDVARANPRWHPRTVETRVRSTQQASVEAVRGFVEQNDPWDVRAEAREVTAPVHVLVASSGSTVPSSLADELAAANPLWTFETVPDTTHSIHRDRPGVVQAGLLAEGSG